MEYLRRHIEGTDDEFTELGQMIRDAVEDSAEDVHEAMEILNSRANRSKESIEQSLLAIYNGADAGADYLWAYALVEAGIPAGTIIKVWETKLESFQDLQTIRANDEDRQRILDSLAPSRTPRDTTV